MTRIPPLLLTAVLAALMWPLSWLPPELPVPNNARVLIAPVLAISGAIIAALGVAEFRARNTTVNPLSPEAASALVTSGIYRLSRNPMYLGFFLLLLGWGLFLASPYALALAVGFASYLNRFQIVPEETALQRLFGPQFIAYKNRTRRWL